jgi:ribose transport system substrate-binding protein
MGYLAVRTIVDHVRGEKVSIRTDTGAKFVHRENLDQPEIQALVKPDLAKWLGEN